MRRDGVRSNGVIIFKQFHLFLIEGQVQLDESPRMNRLFQGMSGERNLRNVHDESSRPFQRLIRLLQWKNNSVFTIDFQLFPLLY